MKKYYPLVRQLHLYLGLFISPFILIFSLSALVFNHVDYINQVSPIKKLPDIKTRLQRIPYDTTDLATAKAILRTLNLDGEVDFISKDDDHISFPVHKPGLLTKIRVDTHTDSVVITRQEVGPLRAMTYLHAMPGQHNAKMRGNSGFIKVWRVLADTAVYLILFLSVSGVFLWWFLKVERTLGVYALLTGAFLFIGLLLLLLYPFP